MGRTLSARSDESRDEQRAVIPWLYGDLSTGTTRFQRADGDRYLEILQRGIDSGKQKGWKRWLATTTRPCEEKSTPSGARATLAVEAMKLRPENETASASALGAFTRPTGTKHKSFPRHTKSTVTGDAQWRLLRITPCMG